MAIFCYGISKSVFDKNSQYEIHSLLRSWGLPVAKEKFISKCKNVDEIIKFANFVENIRKDLPFDIDGIVVKVDDLTKYSKLGSTGKAPRWAVAYKFAAEQAYTKIEDITVQIGRTGVLTPVAELKPTHLAGSTISRATLHNEDEIRRKDIRIGDFVIIEKGGDVIPKVVGVDFLKRSSNAKPWYMPDNCPICRTKTIQKEGEVATRCPNPKCSGQKLKKIIFFASKPAMDIENLGIKIVEKLVNLGLIAKISDIYVLNEDVLKDVAGFKEKSIQNLLEAIEKSKDCDLYRFILALEIPYVGKETAEILAKNFKELELLENAEKEKLVEIDGIGEKVADSILSFFQDDINKEEIKLLLLHGVKPKSVKSELLFENHPFENKTFVLTGELEKFKRDEAAKLIKDRGGKTSSSVSKKTNFLLLGENPGSKYKKAKALNVQILTEKEFEQML